MSFDEALEAALSLACSMGAEYADARSEETLTDALHVRNGAVTRLSSDRDSGWGIHVLAGGGWGFAATSDPSSHAVPSTVQRAVDIARASGAHRKSMSNTEGLPSYKGTYSTTLERDPFAVPLAERIDLLGTAVSNCLTSGKLVKSAYGHVAQEQHKKRFVNTLGADLTQSLTFVQFSIAAIAVDESGYSYRRSFDDMSQAGWEFLTALNLPGAGIRIGREASDLVTAPWAPSGPRQVILGSDFVSLLVHESCGHPSELDRVLGWEAAFAGNSFLTPEMRGNYRYGSDLVNMTADSLLPGGLGTFGWDEEGTAAQRTPIVRKGIFENYLSSRESAAALGEQSNGCGRAISWGSIPIVRMVNLSLEPGSGTLDELISLVDDGLYIETPSSWSLDDKRMNFHFSGELCREIKGGKLGELRKGAAFQGRTPQFWGSVKGIAGRDEWRLWGFPHCAKGEPLQLCPVSHGAAPILVEELNMSGGH